MGWEGPVTNRQVILWSVFLRQEMDRPSRTDFYLMRVAFEAFWAQRKYPKKLDLEPFRLNFGGGVERAKDRPDKDTASAMFKASFVVGMGIDPAEIVETPPPENQEEYSDYYGT